MAKDWAKAFYKSAAWQKCRAAYIQSVFGLCERCQRPGWIVHHKEKLTPANINNPDVTLSWENLEYLCQDCHNREHGNASTAEGLMFDENGDLVEIGPPRVVDFGKPARDRGGDLREPRNEKSNEGGTELR